MLSLWTVDKPNHKPRFLSDTGYKTYLPIVKSIKYEQRTPHHYGHRYEHAYTLHKHTCAGEHGMEKLIPKF